MNLLIKGIVDVLVNIVTTLLLDLLKSPAKETEVINEKAVLETVPTASDDIVSKYDFLYNRSQGES